jgi:hypothetical protein
VRRAVRFLSDVGDYFVVLARETAAGISRLDRVAETPLRQLLERGQSTGAIRRDISSAWLTDFLVGLVVSRLAAQPSVGTEDDIADITGLFLDGARGGAY